MIELKPCPFCGNHEIEWQESHVGFSIECYTCEYHVGGDLTLKAVVELWNKRADFSMVNGKQLVSEAALAYLCQNHPDIYAKFYELI